MEWWLSLKRTLSDTLKKHSQQVTRERNKLVHALTSAIDNPNTPSKHVPSLQTQLHELLSLKQQKAEIFAGAKREEIGDTPTASFYARAAARAAHRDIHSLTLSDDTITHNASLAQEALHTFWGEVFGPPAAPPSHTQQQAAERALARLKRKVTYAQRKLLMAAFTPEEVKYAAHKGEGKAAPGLDGLPRLFYTHYWSELGPILQELVLAVQGGLTLPEHFNHGAVALLPKTDKAHPYAGDFRPITLLNVDYKIIAGCVAERIKQVLPSLIHITQTGFVPGRLIFENLTFTRDLIDWSKHTHTPIHIAFLDFEKAFDRVG